MGRGEQGPAWQADARWQWAVSEGQAGCTSQGAQGLNMEGGEDAKIREVTLPCANVPYLLQSYYSSQKTEHEWTSVCVCTCTHSQKKTRDKSVCHEDVWEGF